MNTNIYHNKLLSAGKTAEILGLKESTLAQYRWRGDTRLPWVKRWEKPSDTNYQILKLILSAAQLVGWRYEQF